MEGHTSQSPSSESKAMFQDSHKPDSGDVAASSSVLMEKWGYDLNELYRIAVKFFKGTTPYCL